MRLAPDVLWDLTIGSVEQRGERFEPGNDVFLHLAAKAAPGIRRMI
ncbi:MAG: hypothetical protein U0361_05570 [Nitrospiraceae bacterium]